ncbi:hypothetical protein CLAFUW4_01205 [Fulvia fulva]|uniref:EamA domain-containing protein n=1 Tax=Passalora fulva TaxID=5499 RepID=A0A9Q8L727_PASFU|nr:uncharacterized protein CLAFUR5_01210 [Fulvia fulva]KAK4634210.1 hypothetical protein CLAFUR4_01206 [Fulvia fulva]KAK4638624.1 hypothetical protein CLAFUR0_01207 [Fulvia fulva]UJO11408.1 hypothetical protein CLAFUR5_01210 [Fulvia fulva]WPV09305.1 hypothetical protein CLAFUW4_01205 [Fulvia fulva]WPV24698.1 hypothetical protein CLAFUW7_01210 [Fulvia fulva]
MPKPQPAGAGSPIELSGSSLLCPDHFHARDNTSTPDPDSSDLVHLSKETSRQPTPLHNLPHPDRFPSETGIADDEDSDFDDWSNEGESSAWHDPASMPSDLRSERPSSFHKPCSHQSQPLLSGDKPPEYESPPRPGMGSRRSTRFRERDPPIKKPKSDTRTRYTYAACFLLVSLVSFAVQTETAVYIQHDLHWTKPYCMLYFTHGSWSLLWPVSLLILRLSKWSQPLDIFWRRHVALLRNTAQMIEHRTLHVPSHLQKKSPIPYFVRTTAFVTCALTVAGGSWYVAVDLTTASDLTAIYNCSAFFAYAFAVPILKEKLRLSKVVAVGVAILGVLVVAYGDQATAKHGSKSGGGAGGPSAPSDEEASNRAVGNLVIGIGSVLYGFYEVLYKKVACPPEHCDPKNGMVFANAFGSMIGVFTLLVLWIPLPILHFTGIEPFELPSGEASWMLAISVLSNATFSGSFLVLISLTSPVLSSVAALLTIFIVALCDQMLPPPLYSPLTAAALSGGLLIIFAFLLLTWSTYKEMEEENKKSAEDRVDESDVESVV